MSELQVMFLLAGRCCPVKSIYGPANVLKLVGQTIGFEISIEALAGTLLRQATVLFTAQPHVCSNCSHCIRHRDQREY